MCFVGALFFKILNDDKAGDEIFIKSQLPQTNICDRPIHAHRVVNKGGWSVSETSDRHRSNVDNIYEGQQAVSRIWKKYLPEQSTLSLDVPEFPCNAVKDRPREASVPNMCWIHSAVLTQYQLVTDTRTDTQTPTHS